MSRTALLAIDVQSALISGADRGAEVLATISHLVERARAAGTATIYLQHCHATYQPMMKGGCRLHHHYALANLAHPQRRIAVIASAEIDIA